MHFSFYLLQAYSRHHLLVLHNSYLYTYATLQMSLYDSSMYHKYQIILPALRNADYIQNLPCQNAIRHTILSVLPDFYYISDITSPLPAL